MTKDSLIRSVIDKLFNYISSVDRKAFHFYLIVFINISSMISKFHAHIINLVYDDLILPSFITSIFGDKTCRFFGFSYIADSLMACTSVYFVNVNYFDPAGDHWTYWRLCYASLKPAITKPF